MDKYVSFQFEKALGLSVMDHIQIGVHQSRMGLLSLDMSALFVADQRNGEWYIISLKGIKLP